MPDWSAAIRERLAALNLQGAREAEIIEEMSDHLDERYRALLAEGHSEDAAADVAMKELETRDLLASELRRCRRRDMREPARIGASGGRNMIESFWHDLKVSARMIRVRPAFSSMVIGMLALGVAGNAAIFSIFNGLYLRPLPFAKPERLVDLDETSKEWNLKFVSVSAMDAYTWLEGNTTFEGMAFFNNGGVNLSDSSGVAQRIKTAAVSWRMLDVLGLKPALGRAFLPQEDRPEDGNEAMLGYDLWQRLFHGDRNVLGRVLKLDEKPHTVVGVLPKEAVLPPDVDLWTPLAANPKAGGSYFLSAVGRLKPGVTPAQALADLTRVHKGMIANGQPVNKATAPVVTPLRDRYLGDFKTITRILLGAVGVVLLIACVNIAGLMLVRGEARAREIAIRSAIGASRGRVVRQLLTESVLLAFCGGVLGVGLGAVALRGMVSLMPDDLPRWIRFDLDGRFAVFCALVTGGAALVFGLAPALQAASMDARGFLQETARSTLTRGKRLALSGLVVCEVALALLLLTSSGLLVQAFRKVMGVNPGFRPENVLTWTLRLPDAAYAKPPQKLAFYRGLIDRLNAMPGVVSASATSIAPLDGHAGYFFAADGAGPLDPTQKNPVVLRITSMAGYLHTMGMRLVSGRDFDQRDEQAGAPRTALVNETFARLFWGTTNVVGKRIRHPWEKEWIDVVGVVRDVWHYGLDGEMRPCVFVPYSIGAQGGMTLAIRTAGDPHQFVGPAREIIHAMDPDLPMFNIRTMTERLDRSLWVRRTYSWLFAVFSAVAMILAAAGIYGVVSFAVSQRTREIGIRIALGAQPGQVMRGVLSGGMLLVTIGVLLGLAASQAAVNLLSTLLFGVDKRDPATYAVVVLGVAAIGILANYVPARRAAGVTPMRALGWER